jgi:hypothetical protein
MNRRDALKLLGLTAAGTHKYRRSGAIRPRSGNQAGEIHASGYDPPMGPGMTG